MKKRFEWVSAYFHVFPYALFMICALCLSGAIWGTPGSVPAAYWFFLILGLAFFAAALVVTASIAKQRVKFHMPPHMKLLVIEELPDERSYRVHHRYTFDEPEKGADGKVFRQLVAVSNPESTGDRTDVIFYLEDGRTEDMDLFFKSRLGVDELIEEKVIA